MYGELAARWYGPHRNIMKIISVVHDERPNYKKKPLIWGKNRVFGLENERYAVKF